MGASLKAPPQAEHSSRRSCAKEGAYAASISRNRSAVSTRDILRRERSSKTAAEANAAKLSLTSTVDFPPAHCRLSRIHLMHKPAREHSGPSKKPAPNMEIQVPVKLPTLPVRHQFLLDPIDRELTCCLSRTGILDTHAATRTVQFSTDRKPLPAPRNSLASVPIYRTPLASSSASKLPQSGASLCFSWEPMQRVLC